VTPQYRFSDNLSYKFVAFGVAVILWMSMLGRKDSTLMKDFEIQVILSPGLELETQVPQIVRVEVSGPRVALKKINQMSPVFTVDLANARPGRQLVLLSRQGLALPIGARIVALDPSEFTVVLRESRDGNQERK
jgi:YbbR domain-containing protein